MADDGEEGNSGLLLKDLVRATVGGRDSAL